MQMPVTFWMLNVHLGYDCINETTAISQATFSWIKIFAFWFKFHWILFLRVQFTRARHQFSALFDAIDGTKNELMPFPIKNDLWQKIPQQSGLQAAYFRNVPHLELPKIWKLDKRCNLINLSRKPTKFYKNHCLWYIMSPCGAQARSRDYKVIYTIAPDALALCLARSLAAMPLTWCENGSYSSTSRVFNYVPHFSGEKWEKLQT